MKKEETKRIDSCIMEGMISFRSVIYGIENGITDRKIQKVLYDGNKERSLSKELSYIKAMSYKHSFIVEKVDSALISELALGTTHGGILTFCTERSLPNAVDFLTKNKNKSFLVYIEGIEDPYNFGYCLRSLYAAGVDCILLGTRNWMNAAGVVCRSSAGASEKLDLLVCDNAEELITYLKNQKYKIICSDIKNSVPMWESDLELPLLLIVGGERRGISASVSALADLTVRIDYGRDSTSALSAASAATLLSFEVLRQNRKLTK